jgi:hypothetical protein
VNRRNQAISALPVVKIENANSVRPFGDYSIHAIKSFTQVIKRAAIGQMSYGGFPDGVEVEDGYITMPELPGIGFEGKSDLYREMQALSAN